MSDTPPAKKAKGESASPWAGLRQKLQAAPQTPVRMGGVGNSPAVASPSATTTEASAQLFFGESICVFAAEEARGLVCGAQVGNDMVCFNPTCPIETHKTGDRAFPEKSTGIFLRASAAPTKRFRVLREPIGNLDFFNRHNNILRRIQEYDPLKWQGVETILEQQPPVDSATLESQLREHTTLLNTLQLPDGEDYFLPKPQRRSPAPPSPEMGAPGGGTTSSGDEDITTDDDLPDWPRALIAAEANLTRSTEEALEVSKYDDLLKGEFLETYEHRPHLNFSDLGKPYYKLSEEMLRLLKVQHNKFDAHSSTTRAAQKLIFERLNYQQTFLDKDAFDDNVSEFKSIWEPIGKLIKGNERSKAKIQKIASELDQALEVVSMLADKSEEALERSSRSSRILDTSSSSFSRGIEQGWTDFWREVAIPQVKEMVTTKVLASNNDLGNELIQQVAKLKEESTSLGKRMATQENLQARSAGELVFNFAGQLLSSSKDLLALFNMVDGDVPMSPFCDIFTFFARMDDMMKDTPSDSIQELKRRDYGKKDALTEDDLMITQSAKHRIPAIFDSKPKPPMSEFSKLPNRSAWKCDDHGQATGMGQEIKKLSISCVSKCNYQSTKTFLRYSLEYRSEG
jgi:hypothetical protein